MVERKQEVVKANGTLADFFATSPLRGSKMNVRRREMVRKVDI
jgi:hypothetical protein